MKPTTATLSGTMLETAVRLCTAGTADPAIRRATLEITRREINIRHRIENPDRKAVTVSVETLPLLYRTVHPPEIAEATIVLDYGETAAFLRTARGDRVRLTHRPPAAKGRRGTVNLENIERRLDLTSGIPDCEPLPAPPRTTGAEVAVIGRQTLLRRLDALAAFTDTPTGVITVTTESPGGAVQEQRRLVLGARTETAEAAIGIEPMPGNPPLPTSGERMNLEIPPTAAAALALILHEPGTVVTNQVSFKAPGNITMSLPREERQWLGGPTVYIDWNETRDNAGPPGAHRDREAEYTMTTGAESLLRGIETIASGPRRNAARSECVVKFQPHLGRLTNADERCRHRIELVAPPSPDPTEFTADARELAGILKTLKANNDWGNTTASTTTTATIKLYRGDGETREVEILGPHGDAGRAQAGISRRCRK